MCLTGDKATNVKKEEEIDPRCIVKFRPADDWKGEYGFDWFRMGDCTEKTSNSESRLFSSYSNIMQGDFDNNAPRFIASNKYDTFSIKDENGQASHEDIYFVNSNEKKYIVPVISLFYKNEFRLKSKNEWGETKAKVNLLIYANNISEIDLYCLGNKGEKITISKSVITDINNQEITIEINRPFDQVVSIKAYAKTSDDIEKKLKGTLSGQLNVRCVCKFVDLILIPVKIRLPGGPISFLTSLLDDAHEDNLLLGEKNIRKLAAQAGLIPRIEIRRFSPESEKIIEKKLNDGGFINKPENSLNCGRHSYDDIEIVKLFEEVFNAQYDFLENAYKVFFFGVKANDPWDPGEYIGITRKIPSKAANVYKGANSATACHEFLHSMGLRHPSDSTYNYNVFDQGTTSNIMDYTWGVFGENDFDRLTLWNCQWNTICSANGVRDSELELAYKEIPQSMGNNLS